MTEDGAKGPIVAGGSGGNGFVRQKGVGGAPVLRASQGWGRDERQERGTWDGAGKLYQNLTFSSPENRFAGWLGTSGWPQVARLGADHTCTESKSELRSSALGAVRDHMGSRNGSLVDR